MPAELNQTGAELAAEPRPRSRRAPTSGRHRAPVPPAPGPCGPQSPFLSSGSREGCGSSSLDTLAAQQAWPCACCRPRAAVRRPRGEAWPFVVLPTGLPPSRFSLQRKAAALKILKFSQCYSLLLPSVTAIKN